jgi:transcriptional regulator with XRE-family HTH domain
MLVEYRADHALSQRALAEKLGVSQPRVARMESGEQNPDVDTIIATVGKLGTEFVLDVAPAAMDARLVTKGARTSGAVVRHGNVSVTTAFRSPPVRCAALARPRARAHREVVRQARVFEQDR